jgi:hypothetical protein
MSIDRVFAEVSPGAAYEIARLVVWAGGWVCEEHPDLEWPHDDCPGPGMLRGDVE